jgi:hypothetical protein
MAELGDDWRMTEEQYNAKHIVDYIRADKDAFLPYAKDNLDVAMVLHYYDELKPILDEIDKRKDIDEADKDESFKTEDFVLQIHKSSWYWEIEKRVYLKKSNNFDLFSKIVLEVFGETLVKK